MIRYLGRYTHRVGISNQRLVSMDERGITFRTKDGKSATLSPDAFLQRFLSHVLPNGFVKIRHYGLMASSHATTTLETARALLAGPVLPTQVPAILEGGEDSLLATSPTGRSGRSSTRRDRRTRRGMRSRR